MTLIKRYKLISSPSFEKELEKIHCYLSKQLNEPDIANKFYSKVRLQVNSLKYFPERNIRIINKSKKNIRRILIDKYVVIYEVKRNTRASFYITYFSL